MPKPQGLRKKAYALALQEAQQHGIAGENIHANPADVLQKLVNRLTSQLRFASAEVDKLSIDQLSTKSEMFGSIDHEWVRMETRLQERLITLCSNMERIGIADRSVQVSEAFAAILVPMLRQMMSQLELTPEQQLRAPAVIQGALLSLEQGDAAA